MGQRIDADVRMPRFGIITGQELCTFDLLIVGSPTQQGKPLHSITILIDAIPPEGLRHTKVAAFDTRHKWKLISPWGYAAPHLAKMLTGKGGLLLAPPEGFLVNTTRGPIKNGELDRAVEWVKSLLNLLPAEIFP
jgi:flavodoxin I